MKKILLLAAAVFAMAGCQDENQQTGNNPGVDDSISLSTEEKVFESEGGKVQVMVTSNGDWSLTSKDTYEWVTSDCAEGIDGDVVTFRVNPNGGESALTAEFTFVSGKASASFTITVNGRTVPEITVVEGLKHVFDFKEHRRYSVNLKAEGVNYQQFKIEIEGGEESWVKYLTTLSGATDGEATVYFDIPALEGLADRTEKVTVSAPGTKAPVVLEFVQEAEHVLSAPLFVPVEMAGGVIEIPVTTNVEYEHKIEAEQPGWVTYKDTTPEGVLRFDVASFDGGKRSANIVLTQTDAKEGEEALTATVKVTQQEVLVEWAAQMKTGRLFPKWDGPKGGPGECQEFTIEMLIRPDELNKQISTLFGIEGQFLLRFGDAGKPANQLQIARSGYNYDIVGNVFVPVPEFKTGQWYHIALTFNKGMIVLYVNGKGCFSEQDPYRAVHLSPMWSYEGSGRRCFWFGYSYDQNRDFCGAMTEIRIWTKALTKEEINAPDHFYKVDPASEGLFSYWKMTKNSGTVIEDATGNGNNLYGELDVMQRYDPNFGVVNKGVDGIKFESVSLPEK